MRMTYLDFIDVHAKGEKEVQLIMNFIYIVMK